MATLVFTALGTAIGGPIGGALGSLVGSRIDRAIVGSPHREGPRLRELGVTTSSYGSPIARHFGTMRAPGTIIWATDLTESSEESGGGKGRPSTTTYSYSASFAVTLASRPIVRLGRVWADGNLLRGAAGDLKAGGELRVYLGHGDQEADPLIASAQGAACPAFRGLAYCVFEGLQLADFGNRIPALTFEVIADEGEVTLVDMLQPVAPIVEAVVGLPGLKGFSDEGGPLVELLETVGDAWPLACDAGGVRLTIRAGFTLPEVLRVLPEAVVDASEGSFGGPAGRTRHRRPDAESVPNVLRYYDPARDYQVGLQRAEGLARPGHGRTIDFPGALDAATARGLANAAAERASSARETLAWRVAEIDPAVAPGSIVAVSGEVGLWRVESWEWRESGVELELARLPRGSARQSVADAGGALTAPDLLATPTELIAYELPWDGRGTGETRQVFAAASSSSAGWTGAALYLDRAGELVPLGASGARRSRIGQALASVAGSAAVMFEPDATLEIQLVSADFVLSDATLEELANGANRALLGGEVLQFARAGYLGDGRWLLRGLLRGRGGTERAAQTGHAAGTAFALLDDGPVALDAATLGETTGNPVVAIGLADVEPVSAPVANEGLTLRPLTPVHPLAVFASDSALALRWARRARGAWAWADEVETPLNEQAERYLVGIGSVEAPAVRWDVDSPALEIAAATMAGLSAEHSGEPLWVRQVGSFAASEPLLLTTIP